MNFRFDIFDFVYKTFLFVYNKIFYSFIDFEFENFFNFLYCIFLIDIDK